MRTLLLGRKMKATDAKTIQEIGIPSMVLMERAAMAVAAEAEKAAKMKVKDLSVKTDTVCYKK